MFPSSQDSPLPPPAKKKSDIHPESSTSQDSPIPPPPKRTSDIHPEYSTSSKSETLWPDFYNKGQTFSTTFEGGKWKCPICGKCTPRIQQHLATHKALLEDWDKSADYCRKIAALKIKESKRKADEKRAGDPNRKESLRKADEKRAGDPKRKEALRKAGKKADQKRAGDPKRKESLKKDNKTYAETRQGKIARLLAQEKYRYSLDDARRKAQRVLSMAAWARYAGPSSWSGSSDW